MARTLPKAQTTSLSDALAFLVSVGDREANTRKLDSSCVTSGAKVWKQSF